MHQRLLLAVWLSVGVLGIGCTGAEPGPSEETPDLAGTPGGEGAWQDEALVPGCTDPDGGIPAGTVQVVSTLLFHTEQGAVMREEDLSLEPPHLWVMTDAGTFARRLPTLAGSGLQFHSVPPGPYFLKQANVFGMGDLYVYTAERQLDIGTAVFGRADAVDTSVSSTAVRASLTGLSPWTSAARVQLMSPQLNMFGELGLPLATGQTSASNVDTSTDSLMAATLPVFEAAKGDRLYVNQLEPRAAGSLPDGGVLTYNTVVRSGQTQPFSFTANETSVLPLSIALQPVPMTTRPVDWWLADYPRHAPAVHPAASLSIPSLSISAVAHGAQNGWVGYSGELLNLSLPRGMSQDFSRQLSVGNPYPAAWSQVACASVSYRVVGPVPGTTSPSYTRSGSLGACDVVERFFAGPIMPRLTPPRGLTIDGQDAYAAPVLNSLTPVISWQPPLLGTPTAYRVFIYERNPSLQQFPSVARILLPASFTQLRLPPEVLSSGKDYYVKVQAVQVAGEEPGRRPNFFGTWVTGIYADTFSAFFKY